MHMIRTAIGQNYQRINSQMYYDVKNLHSLPELIPQSCLRELVVDGIELEKANYKLNQDGICQGVFLQKIYITQHFTNNTQIKDAASGASLICVLHINLLQKNKKPCLLQKAHPQ